MFGRNKEEPKEPEPDKEMEELKGLQAELDKVKQRFENMRDKLKRMNDAADMRESFHFKAMTWELRRVGEQLDQTDLDDIKENKRLQAKLERNFAKKPKPSKPKLTRTQALIEKAKEQSK